MTKCDTHTKIGVSSDGKYDCYFSTNSGSEIKLLNEFKKTEIQIIEKKNVLKMVLFYQKKLIQKIQKHLKNNQLGIYVNYYQKT